jgi:hypothetical protein
MFAQIIRGKVSDPDAVRPVVDRWMTELGPSATGWLGSTSGITEDRRLFVLVRFESEEAAKANSDRPEQGQWWAEMEKLLDVDTRGDLDSAGFVQVMGVQTSDPERSRQLMTQTRQARVALRPDIIGEVVVGHGDGKFTVVNYFVNEEAARRAERQEMPAELRDAMQEVVALGVGERDFLDLRMLWLDSPR